MAWYNFKKEGDFSCIIGFSFCVIPYVSWCFTVYKGSFNLFNNSSGKQRRCHHLRFIDGNRSLEKWFVQCCIATKQWSKELTQVLWLWKPCYFPCVSRHFLSKCGKYRKSLLQKRTNAMCYWKVILYMLIFLLLGVIG